MAEPDELLDDEMEEEQEERGGTGLSGTIIKILIGVILFLVLVFVTGFISWIVNQMMPAPTISEFELSQPSTRTKSLDFGYFPIPSFKLNLNPSEDDEASTTYVTVTMYLAYDKEDRDVELELTEREQQIRHKILHVISSQTYDMINTSRKREEYLKRKLITELNQLMEKPNSIVDIFFTEFNISRI
jgi:flagellar basal body-associated protein FliL